MKKNKHGFTLAEVLLCMTIIGVIMALSMNSIKIIRASYTSLAYFAHKNIVDMVGILYGGAITSSERIAGTESYNSIVKLGTDVLRYNNESLQPMVTMCVNSKGKVVNVLKNDDENYSTLVNCANRSIAAPNTNLFCKSLVALTNSTGKSDCTNLKNASANGLDDPEIQIDDFDKPNFTLSNGMRIYVSKWTRSEYVSNDYGFRIIAVDLNGKREPNRIAAAYADSKLSDVVTFLVLDNGEVYPLGRAADNLKIDDSKNIQYINAKVKGYYFSYKNELGQVAQRDFSPVNCTGAGEDKFKCNLGVIFLQNDYRPEGRKVTNFSYRQALCTAKGQDGIELNGYCRETYIKSEHCPPAESDTGFDLCRVETVKPMFRYNL